MKRVVVGVEELPHSEAALEWAARAALRRGAVLRIVHATGVTVVALDLLSDDVDAGAAALLDAATAHVLDAVPDVEVETFLDRRRPAEALTDLGPEVELLVVGTHRLSAVERAFAGSLAYQVASSAPCPVAVIPDRPADDAHGVEAHGVVVGADGSADGVAAVALAAAEADRSGDTLDVVHAWAEPTLYTAADVYPLGISEALREEEDLVLGESVAGLRDRFPDLRVRPRLVQGQPADALLEAAEHARLLVVGSRGRHGLTRLLLGSTSHTVVLHATCPVLVARTRHPDHGQAEAHHH